MKLSEEEKASHREAFRKMNFQDKVIYILSYYKAYIIIPLLLLIIAGNLIYGRINKKEEVLYIGLVNVAAGDELLNELNEGFISSSFSDPKRKTVILYPNLYISDSASVDNNQYAYASRIKLLGSIEAKKLDVVIANREAYDLLSMSGYLLDIRNTISFDKVSASIVYNDVLINDNRIDYLLDEDTSLDLSSRSEANGIDLSAFPVIKKAGFPETLYLCVIANTPRIETISLFIDHLNK